MKLRSLLLEQLHTTQKISLPEVGKGIHVVLGENGSGKSSCVLAIQGLLWPEILNPIPFPQIRSSWDLEGKELRIERKGKKASYSIDSNSVPAPPVPPRHLAYCHTLTLDDIFENTDSELAEEIERDFAGGYDFTALRESELHQISRRVLTTAAKDLQTKKKSQQATEREQQSLRNKELQLKEKYARIEEIGQQQQRVRLLEKARERLERIDARRKTQQELDILPTALERFRGTESADLHELSEKIFRNTAEQQRQSANLETAMSRLTASILAGHDFDTAALALLKTRLESLRSTEEEIRRAKEVLTEEESRCRDLSAKVPGLSSIELSAELNAQNIEEVSQAFRKFEEQVQVVEAQRRRYASLQTDLEQEELEALLAETQSVQEKLFELETQATALHRSALPVFSLSLLAILGSAIPLFLSAASLPQTDAELAASIVLALACFSSIGLLIARLRMSALLSKQKKLLCDDSSLSQFKAELERRAARHALELEKARQAKDVKRSLAEENQELAKRDRSLREFSARYGAHPEHTRGGLPYFLQSLMDFQRSNRTFSATKTRYQSLRAKHQGELQDLNAVFSRFGLQSVQVYAQASALVTQLEEAFNQDRETAADIRLYEEQLTLTKENLLDAEEKVSSILNSLNLSAESAHEVHQLQSQHEHYLTLLKKRDNFELDASNLEREISEHAPDMLQLTLGDIDRELIESRDNAALKDELLRETASVESEIGRTKNERKLEYALNERDAAETKLLDYYEKDKSDVLSSLLMESVESEYRSTSLPEVLDVAQELFTLFTQGKYRFLPADTNKGTSEGFRAVDMRTNDVLSLQQLSRGTRTQLLLSARLAFAKRHESKHPLPFVMDEVLSTSDPHRFAAVAEAMIRLSNEENRQVIYFSSQPEDASRWQAVSEALGMGEISIHELGASISELTTEPNTFLTTRNIETPLSGETYDSYLARLEIPPLGLVANKGAIPVAHLLDSPERLHQLLMLGIERFSQVVVMRRQQGELLSDEEYAEIEARADVVMSVTKAATLGQGKPLTPEVVIEQKVSETYTDSMIELLERVDYDGKRFISALKEKAIPGFRQAAITRFESHFISEGFVSTDSPLSEADARAAVVAEVTPHIQSKRLSPELIDSIFSEMWFRYASETSRTSDAETSIS